MPSPNGFFSHASLPLLALGLGCVVTVGARAQCLQPTGVSQVLIPDNPNYSALDEGMSAELPLGFTFPMAGAPLVTSSTSGAIPPAAAIASWLAALTASFPSAPAAASGAPGAPLLTSSTSGAASPIGRWVCLCGRVRGVHPWAYHE